MARFARAGNEALHRARAEAADLLVEKEKAEKEAEKLKRELAAAEERSEAQLAELKAAHEAEARHGWSSVRPCAPT